MELQAEMQAAMLQAFDVIIVNAQTAKRAFERACTEQDPEAVRIVAAALDQIAGTVEDILQFGDRVAVVMFGEQAD